MQTRIHATLLDTPAGREADAILRKCVHCGFCLATCPTYNVVGDELDSPRGRIYLMKQMLEGAAVTEKTRHHLDRCLTCRACETTCPSGVEYGRLVDVGRHLVDEKVPRSLSQRLQRWVLRKGLGNAALFGTALALGRSVRAFLPAALASRIPVARASGARPASRHARKILMLAGCVQPALAPNINASLARVLDRLGVELIEASGAGCCGALAHHLDAHEESRAMARRNIDAWWPHVEAGAEAILVTASGCGTQVHDYGHLLQHDANYADKAKRITALMRDPAQWLASMKDDLADKFAALSGNEPQRVAFHSPCSLQHGLKVKGAVEDLLRAAGFSLTVVPDSHLCCGSAGTYSILQRDLSQTLLRNKVNALESGAPAIVATANIGCLTHIETGTSLPVRHWIELLDERLNSSAG